MLRDFCVNFTVLKIKSKKLERKAKYAVLACILQNDFESLVMKLRLLDFFYPDASLRVIDIKKKKIGSHLAVLPMLEEKLGRPRELCDSPNTARDKLNRT